MNLHFNRFVALIACMSAAIFTARSLADPLPGQTPKFTQQPMVNTAIGGQIYFGHDELSTAYGVGTTANPPVNYSGTFMADDFADKFSTPVVHLTWWGSYINDTTPTAPQPHAQKFLIAFESDIPASTGQPFSRPGQVLNYDLVTLGALAPGSGTFTETLVRGPDPVLGEALYKYNAELHLGRQFNEQPDTVYWLKIAALVDVAQSVPQPVPPGTTQWGWHNRDYTITNSLASTSPAVNPGEFLDGVVPGTNIPIHHFQDDAVQGNVLFTPGAPQLTDAIVQSNLAPTTYQFLNSGGVGPIDGPPGIEQHSKDLAFSLFTPVPEPGAGLLLICGLFGCGVKRRRGRNDANFIEPRELPVGKLIESSGMKNGSAKTALAKRKYGIGIISRGWTRISAEQFKLKCCSIGSRLLATPSAPHPFVPVVAIPSMNVFCARKNSTTAGRTTSVLAAIRRCQLVPPALLWKFCRPRARVNCSGRWR